jgi:hypothetical protein
MVYTPFATRQDADSFAASERASGRMAYVLTYRDDHHVVRSWN